MTIKHRTVPFHVKAVEKTGEFSGYASVFDVVDWYRDVVKPGAFVKSLARWESEKAYPPVLWQHMSTQPIGPHTLMREDEKGLYVEGRLLVNEIEKAREAHALLSAGVIRGMSIGYDVPDEGMTYDGKTNVWNLTEIDLWENSIVTFPANREAAVETVKSILGEGKLPTLSDFEGFLREAGFSKSRAAAIASHGLKYLLRSESEPGADLAKGLQSVLEQINR